VVCDANPATSDVEVFDKCPMEHSLFGSGVPNLLGLYAPGCEEYGSRCIDCMGSTTHWNSDGMPLVEQDAQPSEELLDLDLVVHQTGDQWRNPSPREVVVSRRRSAGGANSGPCGHQDSGAVVVQPAYCLLVLAALGGLDLRPNTSDRNRRADDHWTRSLDQPENLVSRHHSMIRIGADSFTWFGARSGEKGPWEDKPRGGLRERYPFVIGSCRCLGAGRSSVGLRVLGKVAVGVVDASVAGLRLAEHER
jgi:hypothetical protein